MHEKIDKVNNILKRDLEDKLDKIIAAGTVNLEDVKVMKTVCECVEELREYVDWEMSKNGNSYGGYSMARGRNMNTGRYMSRDDGMYPANRSYGPYYMNGYSGHGDMIENYWDMYDNAQSEQERRSIREMIENARMNR